MQLPVAQAIIPKSDLNPIDYLYNLHGVIEKEKRILPFWFQLPGNYSMTLDPRNLNTVTVNKRPKLIEWEINKLDFMIAAKQH